MATAMAAMQSPRAADCIAPPGREIRLQLRSGSGRDCRQNVPKLNLMFAGRSIPPLPCGAFRRTFSSATDLFVPGVGQQART